MKPSWNKARRVLCVRLDSLGDVLMCTPAMRALRDSLPGRALTLLASPGGGAVAPYLPEVERVLEYEAPWIKSSTTHPPKADIAFAARLRAHRFDAAVIFTSYSQSALPAAFLCHLAGIPLRLAHCRENPYRMLTDWAPETEPERLVRHEVRRQLDLVASIGCRTEITRLSFALREPDLDRVAQRLAELGIKQGQPWILLHPGASAPSRRYPPRHWAELIRQLSDRLGWPMVVTGAAHETPLADEIRDASGVPVHSLTGMLGLGEMGAALKLATIAVSNNTGPAHIAAAVGTPLVDLYALTNPQHTPWQVRHRVLYHDVPCRFCLKSVCPEGHNDCLAKIPPARVVEAVCSLLEPEMQGAAAHPLRRRSAAPHAA
ncbi:lipopolysaccharide heptosyltransferase II [Massilia horti]|uniref:lipopolysaccharide heptosyltransferase II n=1 Tax=Massilia horti TaxID=2562153 RepID=A0A4Y9T342_9BURK|nr:lipopolysaccharide heptosyltransferase II [Massilia horti]TFW33611.1 lipopolysaccharide heptosyltransferase II [Massilia horti]